MTGTFINRCPAMETFLDPTDSGNRITDVLYSDVTIVYNGVRYKGWLRFPPTKIRKNRLGRFTVDACTASGYIEGTGYLIQVTLNPMNVIGPVAMPVKARGTCSVPVNGVPVALTITAEYPMVLSTPEGGGQWLVKSCEATGTVSDEVTT